MYLDNISEQEIPQLNIPTATPLVYELDANLKPIRHYYLGDAEEAARKAHAVANQAKIINQSGALYKNASLVKYSMPI